MTFDDNILFARAEPPMRLMASWCVNGFSTALLNLMRNAFAHCGFVRAQVLVYPTLSTMFLLHEIGVFCLIIK